MHSCPVMHAGIRISPAGFLTVQVASPQHVFSDTAGPVNRCHSPVNQIAKPGENICKLPSLPPNYNGIQLKRPRPESPCLIQSRVESRWGRIKRDPQAIAREPASFPQHGRYAQS